MANTILTQKLVDGKRDTIIKVNLASDGSGELAKEVIFDASAYLTQSVNNSLARVTYHFDGFSGLLEWDGGGISSVTFTGSGLDDMTSGTAFTGTTDKEYLVEIDATGTPDTFKWSNDGGDTFEATGVAITGGAQTLEEKVTVTFGATTGHTLADIWEFDAGAYMPIITIEEDYSDDLDFFERAGGLYNTAGDRKTGDILLTTNGFSAAPDRGFIVLYMKQKSVPHTL